MARRLGLIVALGALVLATAAASASASYITPSTWRAGTELHNEELVVTIHEAPCDGYDVTLVDQLQLSHGDFYFPGAAFYGYEPTLLDDGNSQGTYTGPILVPSGALNGHHTIVALCQKTDSNAGEFDVTIVDGAAPKKNCKPGYVRKNGQCERKGPTKLTPGHHGKKPPKHHH